MLYTCNFMCVCVCVYYIHSYVYTIYINIQSHVFLFPLKYFNHCLLFILPFVFSLTLMAAHSSTLAWKIPWTEEPGGPQSMGSRRVRHDWATSLSLFTFHFHALEKEMATHSGVLAWKIPGMAEPGGLPSMGLHRVGHDWSDLAAAAVGDLWCACCPSAFYVEEMDISNGSWTFLTGSRHGFIILNLTGIPCLIVLHRYCVFCKLKLCGNSASNKPIGVIFPTALAHFVSLW